MPDSHVGKRFAENLKRSRMRARLSQQQLSERASLHRTEIAKLECGKAMPELDTIVKLAGGLEVAPCKLLDGMWWNVEGSAYGSFAVSECTDPDFAPPS
jgi:transcriptional regulator with XRE-family HTH domain